MDINQLDLRKLRAFQLVSKHGNLRLAAATLNQTIPAISAKIRRLETDLGVALFERLPNKLILTVAGEKFLREVEGIFDRAEEALTALSTTTAPTGRLLVSTASDYSWYFAPRISTFLKRYPGVELNLIVSRGSDAIRALVRGELDLSIGVFSRLPKTLEKKVIVETTMALVCTPGHALLRARSPKLPDIARYKLIVLPRHGETRRLIDKTMANNKARPSSIIEVANCQIASTFVEKGVGVAIAHSLCMEHVRSDGVSWIDLGKHFGRVELSAVYRRGGARSSLMHALLQELAA